MLVKRAETLLDEVSTPLATSGSVSVLRLQNKTFVISGASTPVATVVIEGSLDDSVWVPLVTIAVSATATAFAVNNTYEYVRARESAWTSGLITVKLSAASEN